MKTKKPIDIDKCRRKRNYKYKEYLARFLWDLLSPLFSLSPRNFFFWRNFMLRIFGAKIGKNVHIYPSAKIFAFEPLKGPSEIFSNIFLKALTRKSKIKFYFSKSHYNAL